MEEYFYGKTKCNSLKDRTIKRIGVLGVVWVFLAEERVVRGSSVLLCFFPFQYNNREVSDKFKNTTQNHQVSEGG